MAPYFIFYVENQNACRWAIHRDALSLDNPPVYVAHGDDDWQVECDDLAQFLLVISHLQAGFSLHFASEDIVFN